MAFSQKLFTSLHSYSDPDTRIGELNRIWYDSVTNVFRIQLDDTPGGTVIGGGAGGNYTLPTASATVKGGVKVDGTTITITNQVISATQPDLSGYATLTGEQTLTNKTLTSPTITDGVFQDTFSIGNQIFYEHGYNGFSVNEDFDIVGEGNFTGYHYTSGAGRAGVAFTLARTGQFTTGFGIHGTSESNEYVIGSETANTDFVFKSSVGMPFDVSGGVEIFRISKTGVLTVVQDENTETVATQSFVTGQGYLTSRVQALSTNSATYAIDTDSYDMVVITGQTATITSITTTGTPTNGQKLWLSITGTAAVGFTLSSSNFESSTVTLPTTTVTTARLDIGFVWNVATSKWRCVAQA